MHNSDMRDSDKRNSDTHTSDRVITDELEIAASVDTVWQLTEDVEGWPATTPTITSVERLDDGPLRLGSQARIKQPAQRPAVWTVTTFEPGQEFAWETKVLGVRMVGRHVLTPIEDGVRNTLSVELHGRGAGLLRALVGGRMRKAIVTENQGFKTAAEARATRN